MDNQVGLGVKTEQGILNVKRASEVFNVPVPGSMEEVIHSGDEDLGSLHRLTQMAQDNLTKDELFIQEEMIQYAPSVTNPEKIICVGLNYKNHAEESKMQVPSSPILFSKFSNSLAAHNEVIPLPSGAEKFDYEAELVIVIGKTAKEVSKKEALSYVFGYTVGNDLSARDLQFRTGQWLLGKALDKFAPIGPYIVTTDEIPNPQELDITCKVNGILRQSSNTKDMIFDCATIVSYVSQYMTLKPGDIILSGTPDGVILGYPEEQQIWLKSGDEISVSIEKIGTLTNILS
jgi:2-keto-4-pentenoate hydratase/2-oxohepta-3-ene-1,7-dioic acid hydratase in catechol pathway|nr:fumarylacetoacetate hydrolase family protein [Brevibacillus massiliensis]